MLKAGDKAPEFILQNQDGIDVNLKDLLGKKLVLYFYPKDNTSGCSLEAQDFTSLLEEFENFGANIIGISPDSVQSHKKFIQNKGLKIMLLSDSNRSVSASYGAFGTKKLYGKEVQGIIRSTFIIDKSGIILECFYNVKAKDHAKKVLQRLQEL
ncbi:thioredoxin-dependent thiol peroxidase [Helicobacter cholecystus]|uniref:Putative peroxiredoxin bcp n=1 Tax=Helicobacter cholecystus TaxID=45498 RepID=A0A3D8IW02_9HELI|nr:thioredoxin-dependent thiol peroxidase [Helicobacter cholecystus]RDU69105.1 thioredoxin-dependent thiol peroxidase [Helicobacter cholecystus]VEJ24636.1 bacterioferritin comigratory protein Bcp [Helicobacter cholecystus]